MNKARRARQKANRAAKRLKEAAGEVQGVTEALVEEIMTRESEHAAAKTVLARLREIRKEFHKESDG